MKKRLIIDLLFNSKCRDTLKAALPNFAIKPSGTDTGVKHGCAFLCNKFLAFHRFCGIETLTAQMGQFPISSS